MTDAATHAPDTPPPPVVKSITQADVKAALSAGLNDFQKAPIYGLFIGAVITGLGFLIAWTLYRDDAGYWILPLAAGFPLIGPFAAVGLYEVSRRIEAGEALNWGAVLGASFRHSNAQFSMFAIVSFLVFFLWILLARVIFAVSFGTTSMTNVMSSIDIFFTGSGLIMLFIGSIIGAALASLMFSISAVGAPLLLDRDIDVVTAMITSVKAVVENAQAMVFWGLVVAAAIVVASLPLFLGMILAFPVLGHASWHIYRKAVEPAA